MTTGRARCLSPGGLARRAERLQKEDWEFRSFLKGCGDRKVDAAVRKLYMAARKTVDCRKCRRCCIELRVPVTEKDVARLAAAVGMRPGAFRSRYLVADGDEPRKFLMRERPCPFLRKDGCAHYAARPDECRAFPFLDRKDFASRTMEMISNQRICPIVFEVYQGLKKDLWHDEEGGWDCCEEE
ncbi:MAG: YkgJ family cysteine cluster protein [Euryarchaeota archaeon]|nr:YkgJ family cysteine cluster protein [Euryarchaeota archaeon]